MTAPSLRHTVAILKAVEPAERRAYVQAHLDELAPRHKPRYEGGWWFQSPGHYPLAYKHVADFDDHGRDAYFVVYEDHRDGHSGTTRWNCSECWQARLEEFRTAALG